MTKHLSLPREITAGALNTRRFKLAQFPQLCNAASMKAKLLVLLVACILSFNLTSANAAEPKKLLVVTTTAGYRHSSIPTLAKMLEDLGKQTGEFTVDLVLQPTNRGPEFAAAMSNALLRLSPDNLKNYDGVVFASTTGELPIPDRQGFLDWIKAGHAFIGIHAASDTLHRWPGYIDMLGGEFDHHGAQLSVDCLNQDPQNPATAQLPKVWTIAQEEVYQFKNYDPTKVHELLILDKRPQAPATPGHYPVAWTKDYGTGRVFYTSLGHREDLIDTDPNLPNRRNDVEAAKLYQKHILGGIEWALKLKEVGKAD
jgi:type 1 glutamine amidotransferase